MAVHLRRCLPPQTQALISIALTAPLSICSSTKAQSHPAPDTPFSLVESGMKAMCKGSHFMSACEVFVLVVFKLLR